MKVKDLLKLLIECDPEAEVGVEALSDNNANVVKQYQTAEGNLVYIADDTEFLDENIQTTEEQPFARTSFLELFIEEEIPFRLRELFNVAPEKLPAAFFETVEGWFKENSDIMFDYDAIDEKITDFLDAFDIDYSEPDEEDDEA